MLNGHDKKTLFFAFQHFLCLHFSEFVLSQFWLGNSGPPKRSRHNTITCNMLHVTCTINRNVENIKCTFNLMKVEKRKKNYRNQTQRCQFSDPGSYRGKWRKQSFHGLVSFVLQTHSITFSLSHSTAALINFVVGFDSWITSLLHFLAMCVCVCCIAMNIKCATE